MGGFGGFGGGWVGCGLGFGVQGSCSLFLKTIQCILACFYIIFRVWGVLPWFVEVVWLAGGASKVLLMGLLS